MHTDQKPADSASPVYAFLEKPSMIDFPGHMCGVFFTSGCNFTCGFCHNAVLMGKKQKTLSWERLDEVCRQFKDEWVDAVCITGGEPTLEPGLLDLIDFFRRRGFKIKLDSNGSRPEILRECLPKVDLVAMDIKAGPSGYEKLAGFPNIEKIKESIQLIMNSGVDYEFRTTVITPFHTDEQMLEAGELIKGAKRYCLQAFVPQDALPGEEFRSLARTTPQRLHELEKLMAPFVDEVIVRGA
ncbi:anaerobic ribonucleoside-triphosphate reductase activating protein [Tichowtungia aerotolerans]|uniref:Anaerobic ribonucleoside-triphosphate reductase activating protein n=1 Tax=Tichowtungia aerotolerans TaxID=2697043 RepID=A0A6P1M984_9BACT|nr:anaerobic ribonucleoside-triphosphate reductase activating protein [Tichowtungia aerotolerans]QHI69623.1 anaerobic ribonucleoside-triphosphate reductase activating protein [Tichowtungia aerotolerans]